MTCLANNTHTHTGAFLLFRVQQNFNMPRKISIACVEMTVLFDHTYLSSTAMIKAGELLLFHKRAPCLSQRAYVRQTHRGHLPKEYWYMPTPPHLFHVDMSPSPGRKHFSLQYLITHIIHSDVHTPRSHPVPLYQCPTQNSSKPQQSATSRIGTYSSCDRGQPHGFLCHKHPSQTCSAQPLPTVQDISRFHTTHDSRTAWLLPEGYPASPG